MELEEVSEALLDGFTVDGIKRLLSFELDKELSDYTNTTKGKREVAYELVTAAKREAWLDDLIEAMQRDNPSNPKVAELGSMSSNSDNYGLQRRVDELRKDFEQLKTVVIGIDGLDNTGIIPKLNSIEKGMDGVAESIKRRDRLFSFIFVTTLAIEAIVIIGAWT